MTVLVAETWFVVAPKIPEGEGPEWGKAAPIGLLVIVLLCLAVWLLLRSMSKHMRIVRERFPEERHGFYLDGTDAPRDNPDDADRSDADPTDPADAEPSGTEPADPSPGDRPDEAAGPPSAPGSDRVTHRD